MMVFLQASPLRIRFAGFSILVRGEEAPCCISPA